MRSHRFSAAARHVIPAAGGLAALALLIHGVDLGAATLALTHAGRGWLLAALVLSGISLGGGIRVWTSLVRDRAPQISRRTLAIWHVRSLLAGQVVPSGMGGDAVRGVAVSRLAGTGTALGSLALCRVMAALAMGVWGVAGAALLHDAVGAGVVMTAAVGCGAMMGALALALHADAVLRLTCRLPGRPGHRVHAAIVPIASTLAAWRQRPALVSVALLTAVAGWGVNLAALTLLGRAVGVEAGWQVFAVTIPVTLAATWLPMSANGIGIREGILIGLLAKAGVATGPATALSILVDLQMLPFAVVGGVLWLRGSCDTAPVVVAQPAYALPANRRSSSSAPGFSSALTSPGSAPR